MIGFLWSFHPLVPTVILLGSLPHLLAQLYYGRFGWRLMHRQVPQHRKQGYSGSVMTDSAHGKEVRLFGLGIPLVATVAVAVLFSASPRAPAGERQELEIGGDREALRLR